jgi:hypothetical protein
MSSAIYVVDQSLPGNKNVNRKGKSKLKQKFKSLLFSLQLKA